MRSLFGNRPAALTLFSGLSLLAGVASAEEPIAAAEDSAAPTVVTQSTTTVTTTTSAPPAVAPSLPPPPTVSATVAPAPMQMPMQMAAPPVSVAPPVPMVPYPAAPPPGMGMVPGPVYYNGPVWIIPAPPAGGQPMYAPPAYAPPAYAQPMYAPPVYAPPAPRVFVQPPPPQTRVLLPRPMRTARPLPPPRGPSVAIGLRASMLGISSQQVFGQDVNMWGAGLMVRFRSQGRFGFELGLDAMRAEIGKGAFTRTSYPFTVSPMFYLFQNRPDTHFNIYAVAGFGLMADDIGLYQGTPQQLSQQFWELIGQAGGGVELRFKRLALFGDIRAVGMMLDDSSPAGLYYQNVDGGPIPASSSGYKVNLGALLWF